MKKVKICIFYNLTVKYFIFTLITIWHAFASCVDIAHKFGHHGFGTNVLYKALSKTYRLMEASIFSTYFNTYWNILKSFVSMTWFSIAAKVRALNYKNKYANQRNTWILWLFWKLYLLYINSLFIPCLS